MIPRWQINNASVNEKRYVAIAAGTYLFTFALRE